MDEDRICINSSVVRGLEYYTGPVFEAELTFEVKDDDGKPVRFGSVGGGGRYDDLVARFTGAERSGHRLLDRRVAPAGRAVADQRARKLRRSAPSSCSSWIRPRSRDYQQIDAIAAQCRHPRRDVPRLVGHEGADEICG